MAANSLLWASFTKRQASMEKNHYPGREINCHYPEEIELLLYTMGSVRKDILHIQVI